MNKGNNMSGLIAACVAVTFVALAIGMFGVFWGVKQMDNDYSVLKRSNDELVGDLNVQKEKYEAAAKLNENLGGAILTVNRKVEELEKRSPNVTVTLKTSEPIPVIFSRSPATTEKISPKNSPHKLLKPNHKAPAVAQ